MPLRLCLIILCFALTAPSCGKFETQAVNKSSRIAITSIAAGHGHACAINAHEELKCWGANDAGQLGLGDSVDHHDPSSILTPIDLGTGRTAAQVVAGYNFTCARLDDSSVKCWGENADGQLGQGDTDDRGDAAGEMGDALPTVALGTGRHALSLHAGLNHVCAILDNNTVKCWGRNANGQLGLGDTDNRGDAAGEMGNSLPAVELGTGRTAEALSLGSRHACAILDNASLKCWGENGSGQLGLGDVTNRGDAGSQMGDDLDPVDLGTGHTARKISLGYSHSCAILNDYSVKCWGFNGEGQLGLEDTVTRGDGASEMGDDLDVVELSDDFVAYEIAAGYENTCVVLNDLSTKCWGSGDLGQLGQESTVDLGDGAGEMGPALDVINVHPSSYVENLTMGDTFACALLQNFRVKCWGNNSTGQCGNSNGGVLGELPGEMGAALPYVEF